MFENTKGFNIINNDSLDFPAKIFHNDINKNLVTYRNLIPTLDLHDDPIIKGPADLGQLYDQLRDIAKPYGAIKIKFSNRNVKNLETILEKNLKFQTISQPLIAKNYQLERFHFYYDLYVFLKHSNQSLENEFVKIKSHKLDLFEFNNLINSKGGFDSFKDKNMEIWYSILQALHLPLIQDSIDFLILVYEKILLGFQSYDKDNTTHNYPNLKKRSIDPNLNPQLHPYKRLKIIQDYKGINLPNEIRNFYLPNTSIDLNTFASPSISNSDNTYNFSEFIEKNDKNFQLIDSISNINIDDITIDDFEIFLNEILIDRCELLDIQTSIDLTQSPLKIKTNLDEISLNKNSFLSHFNLDTNSITTSNYNINMILSKKNWSTNDLFLPMIDYNHFGYSKIWYIIPESEFEKFEKLIQNQNQYIDELIDSKQNENDQFLNTKIYEIFSSSNKRNSPDFIKHNLLEDFYQYSNINQKINHLRYNSSFPTINPEILMKNDIKFYRAIQEQDSYIFVLPKTFTSNISTGLNISQYNLFAPSFWLIHYSLQSSQWMENNNYLIGINPFEFLMNVVSSHTKDLLLEDEPKNLLIPNLNKSNYKELKDMLQPHIIKELSERYKFRSLLNKNSIKFKEISNNKFDFISDLSFTSTRGSKIIITETNVDSITISIKEFLQNSDILIKEESNTNTNNRSSKIFLIFNKMASHNSSISITLHTLFEDEILLKLIDERQLQSFIDLLKNEQNIDEPIEIQKNLQSSTKVKYGTFQNVVNKGKYKDNQFVMKLTRESNRLLNKCQAIIEYYSQFQTTNDITVIKVFENLNMNEIIRPNRKYRIDDIHELLSQLDQFPIDLKDLKYVQELDIIIRKISDFDRKLEEEFQIWQSKNETTELLNLSQILGILKKSLNFPIQPNFEEQIIHEFLYSNWNYLFNKYFIQTNTNFNTELTIVEYLPMFYNFFQIGLKYCQEKDLSKLKIVKNYILQLESLFKEYEILLKNINYSNELNLQQIIKVLEYSSLININISDNLLKILKGIIKGSEKNDIINLTNFSIGQKLKINEQYLFDLIENIRGDKLETFQIIKRFDGSKLDERLTYQEVSNEKIYIKYLDDCEKWKLDYDKKFFDNINISKNWQTILSTSLDIINDIYIPTDSDLIRPDIYCYCREGDIGGTMIECEVCKEWYHIDCIDNENLQSSDDPKVAFVCSLCYCSTDNSDEITKSNHLFEFKDLQEVLINSFKLNLVPDRTLVNTLVNLYARVLVFRYQLQHNLFNQNDEIDTNIPIPLIKFFLRKLQGSRCNMPDISLALKNSLKNDNQIQCQHILDRGLRIITDSHYI
ncbi:hypothetical protein TBLA_0A02150 [Henningerozyma blattae CBS 6284]|uniref:PHD-type domain-containing protein n=1 Tax=Henningerozyma blattae (strain ATCC 34711 / CBS 6284 / DSM 70876 / NBRC 10599 / NRRL Y-10934 / UCD 77-7) TaxID=1071380 RepID=I2GV64_HENB6|nr:hypothetical protein TBLA_0A02150 [Tetrapisispora blattae CBS 6284]CCH58016.1 hypothetical protein TBLA_0A02150 [Tetrapisispora blattae CBS 6284]